MLDVHQNSLTNDTMVTWLVHSNSGWLQTNQLELNLDHPPACYTQNIKVTLVYV